MALPIRFRLTLWYLGLLSFTLLLWGGGTHLLLHRSQRAHSEESLQQTWDGFSDFIAGEASEDPSLSALAIAREVVAEYRSRGWSAAVYDVAGRRVAPALDAAANRDSAVDLPPALPPRHRTPFGAVREGGAVVARTLVAPIQIRGESFYLLVARPAEEEQEVLEQLRDALLLSAPVIILLAGIGGYLLAVRALAPVDAMSREALRIGAGNLEARLPVSEPGDELGRLAAVLNDLLSRLQGAFERQRQFMADASHELRTPVAVIRGEAEVALSRRERSAPELREALQITGDEAARLTRIVDDVFTLARADAGQYALSPDDFYLDELLQECSRAVRTLTATAGVELACDAPTEAPVRADEGLVRRMVLNLLDNAIKHSPVGGTVFLSLRSEVTGYRIVVRDTGAGIPPAVQPHIFERFVRADAARTRGGRRDGAGLGLAIARWVAEAHGGSLSLVASGPQGTEFAATLPIAPDSHPSL
jgi:heavy metal sensor kinase